MDWHVQFTFFLPPQRSIQQGIGDLTTTCFQHCIEADLIWVGTMLQHAFQQGLKWVRWNINKIHKSVTLFATCEWGKCLHEFPCLLISHVFRCFWFLLRCSTYTNLPVRANIFPEQHFKTKLLVPVAIRFLGRHSVQHCTSPARVVTRPDRRKVGSCDGTSITVEGH